MPLLLTLKTNLKSLRYGHDRPGGGSSNQPYIQVNTKNSFDLATEELGISGGTDYLLRGGGLTPKRSLQDVSRLGKWGLDGTPPGILGLLFTVKQNALSGTNVRTQAGGILTPNQGVYNPLGTLLQVGTVAFGNHLNKQGADPTGLTPFSLITYSDVVNPKLLGNAYSIKAKNNNRLVQLAHRKIKNSYADGFSVSLVKNNITDGMDSPSFISYRGGPGSGPSIFNTDIRFSDQRTGESNPLSVDSPTKFYGTYKPNFEAGKYLKSFAVPYDDNKSVSGVFSRLTNFDINNLISTDGGKLYQNNVYTEGNTFPEMNRSTAFSNDVATFTQEQLIFKEPISQGGQLTDFRKDVDVNRAYAEKSGMLAKAPNYQNTNIDSLKYINYSSPGDKVRNRSNYGNGSGQIVDAINALYMYKATKADETAGKDLVKFRFAVIDPDSPSEKTFIHFRAYFNGSITDNMNSNWNTFKYAGRGEDFFQYGGFSRDISLSFQVVAQSKGELSIMYQKLNYLQSTLAPNFSDAGYMRGNIHQLTVGGYFYEQPGVLTSLSYTMPDDSTWEIGIDTEGGG